MAMDGPNYEIDTHAELLVVLDAIPSVLGRERSIDHDTMGRRAAVDAAAVVHHVDDDHACQDSTYYDVAVLLDGRSHYYHYPELYHCHCFQLPPTNLLLPWAKCQHYYPEIYPETHSHSVPIPVVGPWQSVHSRHCHIRPWYSYIRHIYIIVANIVRMMRNIDSIILNILFYDRNIPCFATCVVKRGVIVPEATYDVVDRLVLVYVDYYYY